MTITGHQSITRLQRQTGEQSETDSKNSLPSNVALFYWLRSNMDNFYLVSKAIV